MVRQVGATPAGWPDRVFVTRNGSEIRMVDAVSLTKMHDEKTNVWHRDGKDVEADDLMGLAIAQHRSNFDLWH